MVPFSSPAVLSKGIHTTPTSNHKGVPELLALSGSLQPGLSNEEHNGQKDSVSNECRAHDEVCETLAEMVLAAESQGCDTTEEHLRPCKDGHGFSKDTVHFDDIRTHASMDTAR